MEQPNQQHVFEVTDKLIRGVFNENGNVVKRFTNVKKSKY